MTFLFPVMVTYLSFDLLLSTGAVVGELSWLSVGPQLRDDEGIGKGHDDDREEVEDQGDERVVQGSGGVGDTGGPCLGIHSGDARPGVIAPNLNVVQPLTSELLPVN